MEIGKRFDHDHWPLSIIDVLVGLTDYFFMTDTVIDKPCIRSCKANLLARRAIVQTMTNLYIRPIIFFRPIIGLYALDTNFYVPMRVYLKKERKKEHRRWD